MAERRFIDAEALYKDMKKKLALKPGMEGTMYEFMQFVALDCVETAPAIDAKPVVHAHWKNLGVSVDGKRIYECTNCHSHIYGIGNFCKECGAQMDEEEG